MRSGDRFTLSGLLRARKAQEDIARGAVQRARRDAQDAADVARRYEEALGSRRAPDQASADAYAASLSARQAMSAALTAAIGVASDADGVVRDRMSDLTDAAVRRRAVEKLAERRAEEARDAEMAAEQREIDDLAVRAQTLGRAAGRGADRALGRSPDPLAHTGPQSSGPQSSGPQQSDPQSPDPELSGAAPRPGTAGDR